MAGCDAAAVAGTYALPGAGAGAGVSAGSVTGGGVGGDSWLSSRAGDEAEATIEQAGVASFKPSHCSRLASGRCSIRLRSCCHEELWSRGKHSVSGVSAGSPPCGGLLRLSSV